MRVSCKKLSIILKEINLNYSPTELRNKCEAFGKDVKCFIFDVSQKTRGEVEQFLLSKNCSIESDWNKGSNGICINVSYFKAWHWNE